MIESNGLPPAAGALFAFRKDGVLIWEAGVPAVEPVSQGRMFVVPQGNGAQRTGIALANTSRYATTATLKIWDEEGEFIAETERTLEAEGHLALFADELFPANCFPDLPQQGSLSFQTDQPVAALTLLQSSNRHGEAIFSTLPVARTSVASTQTPGNGPLVFPHIGAGRSCSDAKSSDSCLELQTRIVLVNPSSSKVSGRLTLWDSSGDPLDVDCAGETCSGEDCAVQPCQTSSFPVKLAGDGVQSWALKRSAGLGESTGLGVGYAVVDIEEGAEPVGTALFQLRDGQGGLMSEAGVGAVRKTARARIFIESTQQTQTGVALSAFGAAGSVKLDFTLLDRNGDKIQHRQWIMQSDAHTAILANELFHGSSDALPDGFQGLLEIEASQPIYPITLKQTAVFRKGSSRPDSILTTLPLADLDHPLPDDALLVFPQVGYGGGFSTRFILINPDASRPVRGHLRFVGLPPPPGESSGNVFFRIVAGGLGQLGSPEPFFSSIGIMVNDPAPLEIDLELIVDKDGNITQRGQTLLKPQAIDSLGRTRSDAEFNFESLDSAVATVDSEGTLTAQEAGWSTLTVSAGGVQRRTFVKVVQVSETSIPGLVDVVAMAQGMAPDGTERIFLVSRQGHLISLVESSQRRPYAGSEEGLPGLHNAKRLESLFNRPSFITLNRSNNQLFVSDGGNHAIRLVHPRPEGVVETHAGGSGSAGCSDGPAREARFKDPQGVVRDESGIWVADSGNHLIRFIDNSQAHTVQTIAGTPGVGCEVELPKDHDPFVFNYPTGLALYTDVSGDMADSVVVAESNRLSRVHRDGTVEEIAFLEQDNSQPLSHIFSSEDNIGPLSCSSCPTAVAVDFMGNVYFTNAGLFGPVWTLLRTGEVVAAFDDRSIGTAAPAAVLAPEAGRLLVARKSGAVVEVEYAKPEIREVIPNSAMEAEQTPIEIHGSNFAPGIQVLAGDLPIEQPVQVVDSQTIRLSLPGLPRGLTRLSVLHRGGIDQVSFLVLSGPGDVRGLAQASNPQGEYRPAVEARLNRPRGLAIDTLGNIYLADSQHHSVRKIEASTGFIRTVAGTGQPGFFGDGGPSREAALDRPLDVAIDRQGNVLIADSRNSRIRRIDAGSGIISTIAGNGCNSKDQPLWPCKLEEDVPALEAALWFPQGVAVDEGGRIFIADTWHHRIRVVEQGMIRTIAGGGSQPESPAATDIALNFPSDVAVENDGRVYIADWGNHKIRLLGPQGSLQTVAGTGSEGFSGDGGPADQAELAWPQGIGLDSQGRLYIADAGNRRIRRLEDGIISTILDPSFSPQENRQALLPMPLKMPSALLVDGAGRVFASDSESGQILLLSTRGASLFAGCAAEANSCTTDPSG